MLYQWSAQTEFARRELEVLDRTCPVCGRGMFTSTYALDLKCRIQCVSGQSLEADSLARGRARTAGRTLIWILEACRCVIPKCCSSWQRPSP